MWFKSPSNYLGVHLKLWMGITHLARNLLVLCPVSLLGRFTLGNHQLSGTFNGNILIFCLVVSTPLRNLVSWDDYSQNMEKQCSKPPASNGKCHSNEGFFWENRRTKQGGFPWFSVALFDYRRWFWSPTSSKAPLAWTLWPGQAPIFWQNGGFVNKWMLVSKNT